MRSQRSVLALRYTPVSVAGGVRRAVGGFVRYVQFRDQHLEPEAGRALDAYVRYVAHRDRTSPGGRVFGPDEMANSDRRQFVEYIARSTKGLEPKWVVGPDGKRVDRQRAVYTFILSPEDWRGLDLRRLARVAMTQLEADAGAGGIGPWYAAEHRNTAHHHVHIVLAARREVAPGRFSTLLVTRARLQRMKDAIAQEVDRQRASEHSRESKTSGRVVRRQPPVTRHIERNALPRWRWLDRTAGRVRTGASRPLHRRRPGRPIAATLHHLRAVGRRYRRQMERDLERELLHAEREGWTR